MNRRAYLVTAGTAVVGAGAGCVTDLLGGTKIERASDPWRDVTEYEDDSGTPVVEGQVDLPYGTYATWGLDRRIAAGLIVDVRVLRGGAMDILCLPRSQFPEYADGGNARRVQAASLSDVSDGWTSARVSAGEYRVTFDNTGYGGATPSGEVLAEFCLTGRGL